jgi:hypothetical protein
MAYIGASAYAMARDVGEGYILLNATLLKRLKGEELRALRFEIDRLLTSIRGEQHSIDDVAATQQRNRKLSRLNSAAALINNQILQQK